MYETICNGNACVLARRGGIVGNGAVSLDELLLPIAWQQHEKLTRLLPRCHVETYEFGGSAGNDESICVDDIDFGNVETFSKPPAFLAGRISDRGNGCRSTLGNLEQILVRRVNDILFNVFNAQFQQLGCIGKRTARLHDGRESHSEKKRHNNCHEHAGMKDSYNVTIVDGRYQRLVMQ